MDNEQNDFGPFDGLLRAAGWLSEVDRGLVQVDFVATIENALDRLQVPPEMRPSFRNCISNSIHKFRFTPPDAGNHISARDIGKALKIIGEALGSIDRALTLLHNARASIAGLETTRGKALEAAQKQVFREIAGSVFYRLRMTEPSDDLIEAALPSYHWPGFSNVTPGLFARARRGLATDKDQTSFSLTAHDKDPTLVTLLCDLAGLFEEATGRTATAPNPSATQKKGGKYKFPEFVADLWPLMGASGSDEQSLRRQRTPPSNKVIRAALQFRPK